jgi:hypothetical protein
VDDEIAQLVMGCMDKDREKRPTFEELAPKLLRVHKRLGGGLPRLTRPIFTLPTGIETSSLGAGATQDGEALGVVDDGVPRRRWPSVLAILVVLSAVGGVLYALMR